ncbi:MAG TPA: sigma-70 family RNA polymerase sigma factor [Acidobacteriaceae bacterium]|nr:sigma-70 family RNA polymerase sigma factor [Acidobacteriaceae bacterium]
MQISDQIFDDWVRQYHRLLYGIAYWWTGSRSDAEELTQEAFFQAYRSRSGLRDIEAVKAWLVGILRHCYAQMSRKGHGKIEVSLDEMRDEFGDFNPAAISAPDMSQALALHQSLDRLDERHRLPIVLFYFQDLSYREIAEALELPIGTVMSRLSRAREMLQKSLTTQHKLEIVKKVKRS